jgi:hypothetical protein
MTHAIALTRLPRRPMAACLMLAFAVSSGVAATGATGGAPSRAGNFNVHANPRGSESLRFGGRRAPTATVINCDDDGAGSLRATVAAAASGDTIDLSALTCSTISLTSGFIDVGQDDLSLIGPGAGALAIDAGSTSGVIRHGGLGTLSISGLTISHGQYQSTDTPRGGCLYSAANLSVVDSTVSDCEAIGLGNTVVLGGAVYTHGNLVLTSSLVTMSQAHATASGAHGGGVYVNGDLTADYSTISYNSTYAAPINGGRGGGAMIVGTTMLKGSTISYNSSYAVGGLYTQDAVTVDSSTIYGNGASQTAGMRAIYNSGSPMATIVNSTIAGNHSVARVGGLNLIIAAKISNSTIAFNSAFNGLAGVLMSGPTLDLESTIIAGNTASGQADDFNVYGSPVITGANNLVVTSSAPLPPDTITSDPLLGVIGDNGGPTWTIPLMAGSPAIDTGNNAAHLDTDQRGPGFARAIGLRADIGAFEVQESDIIFADGFELP